VTANPWTGNRVTERLDEGELDLRHTEQADGDHAGVRATGQRCESSASMRDSLSGGDSPRSH